MRSDTEGRKVTSPPTPLPLIQRRKGITCLKQQQCHSGQQALGEPEIKAFKTNETFQSLMPSWGNCPKLELQLVSPFFTENGGVVSTGSNTRVDHSLWDVLRWGEVRWGDVSSRTHQRPDPVSGTETPTLLPGSRQGCPHLQAPQ